MEMNFSKDYLKMDKEAVKFILGLPAQKAKFKVAKLWSYFLKAMLERILELKPIIALRVFQFWKSLWNLYWYFLNFSVLYVAYSKKKLELTSYLL